MSGCAVARCSRVPRSAQRARTYALGPMPVLSRNRAPAIALRVGGSEPRRVQVKAAAGAADSCQAPSCPAARAFRRRPRAPSRSIAASSADMKLSPAPTVSTTLTRRAGIGAAARRRIGDRALRPQGGDENGPDRRPDFQGVLDGRSG